MKKKSKQTTHNMSIMTTNSCMYTFLISASFLCLAHASTVPLGPKADSSNLPQKDVRVGGE